MERTSRMNRRSFIAVAGVTGVGLVVSARTVAGMVGGSSEGDERSHEVTPAEDLMFEHGVIERLLLIYGETVRRIEGKHQVPGNSVRGAVTIMRDFGEKYHEILEEQFVFPRLEQAQEHVELTRMLRRQHIAGRRITASLLEMSEADMLADQRRVAQGLRSFGHMYLAHIAYENSVAFRAFHDLVPPEQYMELGEQFEDREDLALGEGGFHKMVTRVGDIEKQLGIYDLDKYTPKMEA
jgi:hemerythrin-like domain-containing protein